MNAITIKHLRYFEALSQARHFGRAAEACAISQPALSLQIKELEEILGAPLVERGARQIRLTGLGEAVAARAQAILRAVEEVGDLARASTKLLGGRFRVGIIPTVAPYLLPAILHALARAHPGLDVLPREAMTPRLIEELMEGRLDAAILALPLSEPSLAEAPFLEEEFLLVRPEADAHLPVPGAERLRDMRLLLLGEGHCFRDQALSYCAITSTATKDLIEGTTLSTLVQMVGAGIGVTLIPEMAVAVETRSARVSVSRLLAPRPTRMIGMVWRRTNPLGDQLERIAAGLRQSLKAVRPSGQALGVLP